MINDYSIVAYNGLYPNNESFLNTVVLHKPDVNPDLIVYDLIIEEEDNVSGMLSFKIPVTNPNFELLKCGALVELVDETKPKTIWFGRLLSMSVDMYGNISCSVEGPMSFLKEEYICSSYNVNVRLGNNVFKDYMEEAIRYYFGPGSVMPGHESSNHVYTGLYFRPKCLIFSTPLYNGDSIKGMSSYLGDLEDFTLDSYGNWVYTGIEPKNIYDFICEHLTLGREELDKKPYGSNFSRMYIEIVQPENYIISNSPRVAGLQLKFENFPAELGDLNFQTISFGENLLDAEIEYDFESVATALMVLGSEYEINDIKKRWTILGGTDTATGETFLNPFISSNDGSIEKYGIVPGIVIVDDLKDKNEVIEWAIENRNAFSNPITSFIISALDLSIVNPAISEIKQGEYYSVFFPGIDSSMSPRLYRCNRRKVNVFDPSNSEYELSYTTGTNLSSIRSRQEITLSNLKKSVTKSENTIKKLEQKIIKYEQEDTSNA